jgi:hypothetical protein
MPVSVEDPTETWNPARLIPTAGIRGQEEQERRATSAFLAVLKAVPEFAHSLLWELGAPKGRISTFTEVQLKDDEAGCRFRTAPSSSSAEGLAGRCWSR